MIRIVRPSPNDRDLRLKLLDALGTAFAPTSWRPRWAGRAGARRAITNAYPSLTGQELRNPEQRAGELVKNLMLGSLSQGSGN